MEDNVISLDERRAANRKREAFVEQDGAKWTVIDMLEDALKDAREGTRRMTKGVFVYLYDTPDGRQKIGFAQANLTHSEEIGFLATATQCAIDDWRD